MSIFASIFLKFKGTAIFRSPFLPSVVVAVLDVVAAVAAKDLRKGIRLALKARSDMKQREL